MLSVVQQGLQGRTALKPPNRDSVTQEIISTLLFAGESNFSEATLSSQFDFMPAINSFPAHFCLAPYSYISHRGCLTPAYSPAPAVETGQRARSIATERSLGRSTQLAIMHDPLALCRSSSYPVPPAMDLQAGSHQNRSRSFVPQLRSVLTSGRFRATEAVTWPVLSEA